MFNVPGVGTFLLGTWIRQGGKKKQKGLVQVVSKQRSGSWGKVTKKKKQNQTIEVSKNLRNVPVVFFSNQIVQVGEHHSAPAFKDFAVVAAWFCKETRGTSPCCALGIYFVTQLAAFDSNPPVPGYLRGSFERAEKTGPNDGAACRTSTRIPGEARSVRNGL